MEEVEVIGFINSLKSDSIESSVAIETFKYIDCLSDDFYVKKIECVEKFCDIEIVSRSNEANYFTILLSETNIEIGGDGFELIEFYDKKNFTKLFKTLLGAFFNGDYRLIANYDKFSKKQNFSMIWNNDELKEFNVINESVRFFRRKVVKSETINGECLVQLSPNKN